MSTEGRSVVFTHVNDRIQMSIPPGQTVGQELTFVIKYHGVPSNGLRFFSDAKGERTAFSENWYNNARQWLPTIDHPSDKATGEFIITTKASYQVVGNGALLEQLDLPKGLRRTHWQQSVPIASWLYAIGIARFVVKHGGLVRGVPISYWALAENADKGLGALERDSIGAFEFFSDRIAPYSYEKLAHVEAMGIGGATEHATNIFYSEESLSSGSGPIIHETAHQWFGNSVTEADWNDVWLSEGFATYLAMLYVEHTYGRDAFIKDVRSSRDTVLRLEKTEPNTPVIHANLDESSQSPLTGFVYDKGAWTLHMLRKQLGNETFWRGLRYYYKNHINGLASTDDFQRDMERVSGQDLAWFFQQWLNRSGVPTIEGSWGYDAVAKQVRITIRQTQTAQPYRFSLDVGIAQAAGEVPRVESIQIIGRETSVVIAADFEPTSVSLDPNLWLLAKFGAFTKMR